MTKTTLTGLARRWKSRITLNSTSVEAPRLTENVRQEVRCVVQSSLIRNDEMAGRSYVVVPMVMMVEGVHAGSNGPLFYPAEELGKTPEVWNMKPVVVYHPTKNGTPVSACSPDILSKYQIGVIMNTQFDQKNRLTAEAWLDIERVKEVDERVLEAMQSKPPKVMELSTGLYTDNEEKEGEWNGEKYNAIARNYRPDHLAVLPDKVGACSVKDGAGFIRNQAQEMTLAKLPTDVMEFVRDSVLSFLQAALKRKPWKGNKGLQALVDNELSHDSIRGAIYTALRKKFSTKNEYTYVEAVYDEFFVYEREGTLYKQGYKIEGTEVEFEGEPIQVRRVTEYRTVDGVFVGNSANRNQDKDNHMNKKEVVDGLIKNHGWKEEDRETLMNLPDGALSKVAADAKAAVANRKNDAGEDIVDTDDGNKNKEPGTQAKGGKKKGMSSYESVEEFIEAAPVEMRGALQAMHASYNKRRAELISAIKANEKSKFSDAALSAMGLEELENIAALAAKPAPTPTPGVMNYAGLAETAPAANSSHKEEALTMPVMDFSK